MRRLLTTLLSAACLTASAAEPAPPPVGFQDFLLVPLRIHLLSSASDISLHTTLTHPNLTRILGKMNRVWGQAGVHFYVETIITESASPGPPPPLAGNALDWVLPHAPPATRGESVFNIYYIKSFGVNGVYFRQPETIFVKDTAALRPVEGGLEEPLPRVTSHELGHALTLPHRQDTFNLMASGTTGTILNEPEIRQAREAAARRPWILTAPRVWEKATAMEKTGQPEEAGLWFQRLASLPLDASPEVQRARQKCGHIPDGTPAPAR